MSKPGKLVFEGGGGAGQPSPKAPTAAAVPWGEAENKAELIFGPISNLSIAAGSNVVYDIAIPAYFLNKYIMIIVFVDAESQITTQFIIFKSGRQYLLFQQSAQFYRTQELFVADSIRLKLVNSDSAAAHTVYKAELWAYDLTKRKVFI